MKKLILFIALILVSLFLFQSCSSKDNPVSTGNIITKVDTVIVSQDTIRMQFQINTQLANGNQYLVYADYGNGYSYQSLTDILYRGSYTTYSLSWFFLRDSIIYNIAKFKIVSHQYSNPNDITLGIVYYLK